MYNLQCKQLTKIVSMKVTSLAVDDLFRQLPQCSSCPHTLCLRGWLHRVATIEVQATHRLHLGMGSAEHHARCCLLLQQYKTKFIIQSSVWKGQYVNEAFYITEVTCSDNASTQSSTGNELSNIVTTREISNIGCQLVILLLDQNYTPPINSIMHQSTALKNFAVIHVCLLQSGLASKNSEKV